MAGMTVKVGRYPRVLGPGVAAFGALVALSPYLWRGSRARGFIDHLAADLLLMGKFIVLGAALAAAMQTIVPQSVFTGIVTTPIIGALIMIVLAFFLSLCSEADAFVAVSFIQFPPGPQLAFLTAGPVLDTKLVLLYAGTFGRAFVLKLALVVVPVVVAGSLIFGAITA